MSKQQLAYPAFQRTNQEIFEEFHFLTNWNEVNENGWKLPGTEEAHDWCGIWKTKGCLNVKGHNSVYENKIFVKQFPMSCFRSVCKVCYRKWMGREANKATRRIEKFEEISGKQAKHIVVSTPSWLYKKPVPELRKAVREILKEIGCIGGTMIFHPYRFNRDSRRWYFSPHFHIIGFGWILGTNVTQIYKKQGWIAKNLGFRDSVFSTFYYQLSHCGVKKRSHALIWFGDLSYCKLKVEKEPDSSVCPACKRKLVPIYHDGVHSGIPPEEVFEDFVDPFDWYEVKTIPSSEWSKVDQYEHVLEKELYNANKGISV